MEETWVTSLHLGGISQHWLFSQHWLCQPALVVSRCWFTSLIAIIFYKPLSCTVVAQSPTIVTQPENCDLEVGTELKLHCKAQCTYPLQYQWFKGQEPLVKSYNSTYSVQQVQLSDTGQYTCRVGSEIPALWIQRKHLCSQELFKSPFILLEPLFKVCDHISYISVFKSMFVCVFFFQKLPIPSSQ